MVLVPQSHNTSMSPTLTCSGELAHPWPSFPPVFPPGLWTITEETRGTQQPKSVGAGPHQTGGQGLCSQSMLHRLPRNLMCLCVGSLHRQ